jgi:Subtilase family.
MNFKYVVFRGDVTINEYNRQLHHRGPPQCRRCNHVGAVLYSNTPAFGVNAPTVASFSSRGGTPVNGVVRNKPDITAPNGGNTTVNMGGQNIDGDAFPNFFGTSAAAPHAAGLAAMILEVKRGFMGNLHT